MKFLILIFLTFSLAHANCELNFKTANICADLNWTKGPAVNQESAFVLKFDKSFKPYQLKVDLWMLMGNHGHGTRPLVMNEVSDSEVIFSQGWFVMKGPWLVRGFLMNEAGSIVESAQWEIKL
ncbi:MAG: hypothetical protein K2P81_17115 [Bacteriovoracaceae bacterium]|nr:hypothetical protein [Bacteriovoracaceae bacterium]